VASQDQSSASNSSQVLMCQEDIRVSTRNKDYSQPKGRLSGKALIFEPTPPINGPLQIERPTTETTIQPPSKI